MWPDLKNTVALFSFVACFALQACSLSNGALSAKMEVEPEILALSSPADYISGGDVLIAVPLPHNAYGYDFEILLNSADATSQFAWDATERRFIGLLRGLKVGTNVVTATFGDRRATKVITNYSAAGPIISGPHQTPYICQTDEFVLPDGSKLGEAIDEDCSANTQVHYLYLPSGAEELVNLPDTTEVPVDVAMTTNTLGTVSPFIVRVETATVNRGIYQAAVLHDPTTEPPPTPFSAPRSWNKRLIAVHGSGCPGGWNVQGNVLGVSTYSGEMLSRLADGYAVFSNTLNHPANSCNAMLAAETTMMSKERFVETFGVPDYTVSTGCSGGAYTSLQVADLMPGIFDGVLISCTYPDALSIAITGMDSKLLARYFLTSNSAGLSLAQVSAVSGKFRDKAPAFGQPSSERALFDMAMQAGRADPVTGREELIPSSWLLGAYSSAVWKPAVPLSSRYHPIQNAQGARATIFDAAINIYGIDPTTGFALVPFDNVGVQYGLQALNAGEISVTQFLDLNEHIGGYDADANPTDARTAGDVGAIRRAYQSGLHLGGGGGLASIPIFDYSGIMDDTQFYHYQWFHFAVRERLREANNDTSNHVMWRGGPSASELYVAPTEVSLAISSTVAAEAWVTFINWMEAYTSDTSPRTQREKVVANKPVKAVDGCFTKSTQPSFIAETQTLNSLPDSDCNRLWPSWKAPRIASGGPVSASILKCELKAIDTNDYKVSFSRAEFERLNAIFPGGVCDWSKRGVGQTGVVPFASFGPSSVHKVYDIGQTLLWQPE
jgi:hypothetical protein